MNDRSEDRVDTRPAVRILARPVFGRRECREVAGEELEGALADGEVVWVDLVEPGPDAASLLGDRLRLGSLTVEDCLLPLRMPKFDPLPEGEHSSRRSRSIWKGVARRGCGRSPFRW